MPRFSRINAASAVQLCPANPCAAAKEKNDRLALAAAHAIDNQIDGHTDSMVSKRSALEDQVYVVSGDISLCKGRAYALQNKGTLQRFNRYRLAMPYANAALELNELGDEDDSPKRQKKRQSRCLTMLPTNAEALNKELGLPDGSIKDKDLLDGSTGFRAALFRSESDGSIILVARDTQPDSLVDWKTNTENGQGGDTDQYKAMRDLTSALQSKKAQFNISGYSKGGGLAQEAGLIAENSTVMVFNSAGLQSASLKRTGNFNFKDLEQRTQSFSAEGDFLTFMNNTTDPKQQLVNARFLRDELAGDGSGFNPLNIKVRNPEMRAAQEARDRQNAKNAMISSFTHGSAPKVEWIEDPDPAFAIAKENYLSDIDNMIKSAQDKMNRGESFQLFPDVRAGQKETIPNSIPFYNFDNKVHNGNPNLAKLIQHRMQNVSKGLSDTLIEDKKLLERFIKECG